MTFSSSSTSKPTFDKDLIADDYITLFHYLERMAEPKEILITLLPDLHSFLKLSKETRGSLGIRIATKLELLEISLIPMFASSKKLNLKEFNKDKLIHIITDVRNNGDKLDSSKEEFRMTNDLDFNQFVVEHLRPAPGYLDSENLIPKKMVTGGAFINNLSEPAVETEEENIEGEEEERKYSPFRTISPMYQRALQLYAAKKFTDALLYFDCYLIVIRSIPVSDQEINSCKKNMVYAMHMLGNQLFNAQKYTEALTWYEKGLSIAEKIPPSIFPKEALTNLKKSIVFSMNAYGHELSDDKNYEEALIWFEKSLLMVETFPELVLSEQELDQLKKNMLPIRIKVVEKSYEEALAQYISGAYHQALTCINLCLSQEASIEVNMDEAKKLKEKICIEISNLFYSDFVPFGPASAITHLVPYSISESAFFSDSASSSSDKLTSPNPDASTSSSPTPKMFSH